jgi:hypothetical protein
MVAIGVYRATGAGQVVDIHPHAHGPSSGPPMEPPGSLPRALEQPDQIRRHEADDERDHDQSHGLIPLGAPDRAIQLSGASHFHTPEVPAPDGGPGALCAIPAG